MLVSVDMYTREMCISEGKDLMEVEYLSKTERKNKRSLTIVEEVKESKE